MSKLLTTRLPIRELPPYIASLIAAGEVIKRPEDIIRELTDNSIDAGATQIEIYITQGGLDTIIVRDNGTGIPKEELPLAFKHHATNKIQNIDDIERIQTLGFRGEALASISAVAQVQLVSRVKESTHGWEVTTHPDKPLSVLTPIAHPVGTTITVRELFHQMPARRRFLRKASTEFARIHQWIKSLSIIHPTIDFQLTNDKRLILHCPLSEAASYTRLSRLSTLYSPEFAKVALPLHQRETYCTLSGWISPPDFSRNQSDWQHLYVNERLIRDRSLTHAIKQAYQDVLYRDRHPIVVLFLELNPTEVDVNVHPTKAEVRFRDSRMIYDFVYQSLKKILRLQKPQESILLTPLENTDFQPSITESYPSFPSKEPSVQHIQRDLDTVPSSEKPLTVTSSAKASNIFSVATQSPEKEALIATNHALGYPLAQLHSTFILAQNDKGLIIVDAHAAHERILYEQLKDTIAQGLPRSQRLLLPITLSLTPCAMEQAKSHDQWLEQVGFQYQYTESNELIIQAIPHLLVHAPIEELIRGVLNDLQEHGLSKQIENKGNQLLATIACRRATQANRTMSIHEMNQLLRSIESTPHSGQCNHGRPTWRQITLNELNSWFLRGK